MPLTLSPPLVLADADGDAAVVAGMASAISAASAPVTFDFMVSPGIAGTAHDRGASHPRKYWPGYWPAGGVNPRPRRATTWRCAHQVVSHNCGPACATRAYHMQKPFLSIRERASGFASESPRAPAPAPPVSRWRSSSPNDPANQRVVISKSRDTPNAPAAAVSRTTMPAFSRWGTRTRSRRAAGCHGLTSVSDDAGRGVGDQPVAAHPPAAGVLLTHHHSWPPPSRVPSPGYASPQPLTRVTIVICMTCLISSDLTHADIGI
jgi:hypothetical protein